jgi:uncharacterized membrane protein
LFELLFKYSAATFANADFVFASAWPVVWLWVLGALSAVGLGFSLWRQRASLHPAKLVVLGALQWAVIMLAVTLLWQPALTSERLRPQDNAVAIVLDTSASMSYGEGPQSRLQAAVAGLERDVVPPLASDFDLRLYGFSAGLEALNSLAQVPAPGQATHIGDALLAVLRESRDSVLGAVVLVSDGADNSQRLDGAALAELASFGVPVHTVGVGRTAIPEDVELQSVDVAEGGLPGTRIGARVSIRHGRQANVELKVYDGDAILAAETVALPDRDGITNHWVDFELAESGLRDLRFTLDPIPGEPDAVNNTLYRPLEVPETRRHVLYIEGEPRWEFKFIRRALTEDSPLRLASLLRTTPNKFYRQGVESADELADGFPLARAGLFHYDALIVGSFEAAALTPEQQEMIRDFVSLRGGSLLMLGGRRGLADGGWGNTVVADALPARLPEIDAPSFMREPAAVILTREGEESAITRLDAEPAQNLEQWRGMPEIGDFQYLDGVKAGASVLLEAEIQGRREPLLVHQRYGAGSVYILASGGTWRWQMQLPSEDQRHETFWRQLLQALATAAPAPVTLTAERSFYQDQGTVVLTAQIRDADFEPALDAEAQLEVTTPSGALEPLTMTAVPGQPGRYELRYEAEIPGVYRFDLSATQAETALGTARTAVRRADGSAEHFQLAQNRALLERIAAATGGRYFALADVSELPEAIRFSEAGVVERELLALWNMPINFLLLLLLKSGEWLLRLRWGRL